jgi:hypothetical protein
MRLRTVISRLLPWRRNLTTPPTDSRPAAPHHSEPGVPSSSGFQKAAPPWPGNRPTASALPLHPATLGSPTRTRTKLESISPAATVAPPRPRRRIQASTLKTGKELGSGGQGRVYVLQDDPTKVAKLFTHPIPSAALEFERILEAGREVTFRLSGQPITVTWPEQAVVSSGGLDGYVMPRIRDDFYFEIQTRLRKRRELRELMFAIPRKQAIAAVEAPSDLERLTLVRLVASFLDAMHRSDLVYGDISWVNFTYALGPQPRLCVLDFDSTRRVGGPPFTRKPAADTVDWHDPSLGRGWRLATLDIDRYKFALLVMRLLITRDLGSPLDSQVTVDPVPGLRSDQVAMLQHLLRRAAGPSGTRPQLSEWRTALSR